MAIYTR